MIFSRTLLTQCDFDIDFIIENHFNGYLKVNNLIDFKLSGNKNILVEWDRTDSELKKKIISDCLKTDKRQLVFKRNVVLATQRRHISDLKHGMFEDQHSLSDLIFGKFPKFFPQSYRLRKLYSELPSMKKEMINDICCEHLKTSSSIKSFQNNLILCGCKSLDVELNDKVNLLQEILLLRYLSEKNLKTIYTEKSFAILKSKYKAWKEYFKRINLQVGEFEEIIKITKETNNYIYLDREIFRRGLNGFEDALQVLSLIFNKPLQPSLKCVQLGFQMSETKPILNEINIWKSPTLMRTKAKLEMKISNNNFFIKYFSDLFFMEQIWLKKHLHFTSFVSSKGLEKKKRVRTERKLQKSVQKIKVEKDEVFFTEMKRLLKLCTVESFAKPVKKTIAGKRRRITFNSRQHASSPLPGQAPADLPPTLPEPGGSSVLSPSSLDWAPLTPPPTPHSNHTSKTSALKDFNSFTSIFSLAQGQS